MISQISNSLTQLSSMARDFAFELLSHKIDTLLISSLDFIPWSTISSIPSHTLPVPSQNHSHQQPFHQYAMDLTEYLRAILHFTEHLPRTVHESIHFVCFAHIHTVFMDFLTSSSSTSGGGRGKSKKFTIPSLFVLKEDVKYIQLFADSLSVTQVHFLLFY